MGDVYMDNLAWMKALKKDPIYKKVMATRDDYVDNDMLIQMKLYMAAAVDKIKFLLKRLRRSSTFFLVVMTINESMYYSCEMKI